MQFRLIVVTDPKNKPTNEHTHKQTRAITIHCTAKLSGQFNYTDIHLNYAVYDRKKNVVSILESQTISLAM